MCTVTGNVYTAGDTDVTFTIPLISKAFIYVMALQEPGRRAVVETVGTETSGEPCNELLLGGGPTVR